MRCRAAPCRGGQRGSAARTALAAQPPNFRRALMDLAIFAGYFASSQIKITEQSRLCAFACVSRAAQREPAGELRVPTASGTGAVMPKDPTPPVSSVNARLGQSGAEGTEASRSCPVPRLPCGQMMGTPRPPQGGTGLPAGTHDPGCVEASPGCPRCTLVCATSYLLGTCSLFLIFLIQL